MALADLKGSVESRWGISGKSDRTSLSDRIQKINVARIKSFTFGSGAGQINKFFSNNYSIALSSTQSINLQDGTEEDPFGDALVFTEVRGLRVYHRAGSEASSINVNGDFITSGLGASTTIPLLPGEYIDLAISLTVTITTADVLAIVNNDGSNAALVDVDVVGI